ncbi:MAG: hypothetical protein JSS66_06055 [Armatimonadetes bacterium]|nr:hypothetical protein [Armatimonadota bacterium]
MQIEVDKNIINVYDEKGRHVAHIDVWSTSREIIVNRNSRLDWKVTQLIGDKEEFKDK